jgi:hypothetical protein
MPSRDSSNITSIWNGGRSFITFITGEKAPGRFANSAPLTLSSV